MDYLDLRGWIDRVRALGELRDVSGARWEDEIGHITEMVHHADQGPAVLFDDIPGYPAGYRILVNAAATRRRIALTLGLPETIDRRGLMDAVLRITEESPGFSPELLPTGPVFDNTQTGADVDVLKFPSPRWHELDGGRYIGTGVAVVMKDPDSDWINLGAYRVMVHDEKRVGVYISPGKHGKQFLDTAFARGERVPVAIVCGMDPLLFIASTVEVPAGVSEYEWVGRFLGGPYPVVRAPMTGLPIPAAAEIVLEGHLAADQVLPEGPFAEWAGYYASGQHPEPYFEVEAVHHRDDPILLGCPPNKPPWEPMWFREYLRSAMMIRDLKRAGIPGIVDAQCFALGGTRLFNAISIRQTYAGHARQVLHAAISVHAGAYLGRIVIVVDDDVDVSDLQDVIWAVITRADPEHAMEIVRRTYSGPLDPAIHPSRKGFNSRLLVDATRPWEWRHEFPPSIGPDPETKRRTRERWGHILDVVAT